MPKHASVILADFFANQDVVWLAEETNWGPDYVHDGGSVQLRVLASQGGYDPSDVVQAAHEIGHFITAPMDRLDQNDYGYGNVRGTWSIRMWKMEFDVLARQVCILRHLKRTRKINELYTNLVMFMNRSGQRWIANVPGLNRRLEGAHFIERSGMIRNHIRDVIEERVSALDDAGGYRSIVEEFHRRCAAIARTTILAA